MNGRRNGVLGAVLVLGGALLIGAGGGLAPQPGSWTGQRSVPGGYRTGMMGSAWAGGATDPGPGEAGFVPGTPSAPRVVRVFALQSLRFTPATVLVEAGETIRFDVTTMGPLAHEFMVGPTAAVAAETAGTPEVAIIAMMQTASLTYTFTGSGPFSYACHAVGHYEAGMVGTIVVGS